MTNLGFALSAVQIRFEVAILFTNNAEFLLPSFRIRGRPFFGYIFGCMELAAISHFITIERRLSKSDSAHTIEYDDQSCYMLETKMRDKSKFEPCTLQKILASILTFMT